jgi:hypothetical protein
LLGELGYLSGMVLGYGLDDRGFKSRQRLGIFLFTTASRTALGPTQPLIQWVPGALSLGIKRSGREADHSRPYSAEVKECVKLYLHSHNTPSWRGVLLKNKVQGQFYLNLLFCHFSLTDVDVSVCLVFASNTFIAISEESLMSSGENIIYGDYK